MSDFNPYQPPSAEVTPATPGQGHYGGPHSRPIGNGWTWFKSAVDLVTPQLGRWIVAVFLYVALQWLAQRVPVGGIVLMLLSPFITAGFMLAAKKMDQTGAITAEDFMPPFAEKWAALLTIGLANFLFIVVVLILTAGMVDSTEVFAQFELLAQGGDPQQLQLSEEDALRLLSFIGLVLIIALPVYMATWFAPALVVFHDEPPLRAMLLSMQACLKNVLPMVLFSFILMTAFFFGFLMLMIGLIFVLPIAMVSTYTVYKDIFLTADASEPPSTMDQFAA